VDYDQLPATLIERRRGQRPGQHDQVPATHNERRRGQRPGHLDQVPATLNKRRRATARNGLCITIKYLRGAAGNGLGTTIKYRVNQDAGAGNNWAKAHCEIYSEFLAPRTNGPRDVGL
jgi:hypothetical protein